MTPDKIIDDLEDYLGNYLILSKDSGPIKRDKTGLSDEKMIASFYGSIFVANREWEGFELVISKYSELGKRLEISEDSIKKAHQRLRDRGILKQTDSNELGHKITDGGLQKLLEDLKDE